MWIFPCLEKSCHDVIKTKDILFLEFQELADLKIGYKHDTNTYTMIVCKFLFQRFISKTSHSHLVLAEKRQRWWLWQPAFVGYLCSSIRTLPCKGLHCVLLDSTLGRLNLRLWTRVRELFLCFTNFFTKLFCQSPTVCEPSQVYLSSTCCQEIGQPGKGCFRHWVTKNASCSEQQCDHKHMFKKVLFFV